IARSWNVSSSKLSLIPVLLLSQAKAMPSKQKARPVWVRAGLLEPYGERQSSALLSRINARPAGDSSEWIQVRQGRSARGNVLVEGRATIRRRLLRAMGSRGTTATQIPSNRLPSRLSGANLPLGLLVLESRKRPGELRPFQNARHKPRFTRRARCQEPVSGPRKNRWLTNVLA